MNKLLPFFFCLFILACCKEDLAQTSSAKVDLSSCFSPELGLTEEEQFFYNAQEGELIIYPNEAVTTFNVGYSIEKGTKEVFIYRHILENKINIDDDEAEIRILFQIDENQTDFKLTTNADFVNSNFIYSECGIALESVSGVIEGKRSCYKIWKIDADLEINRFGKIKKVKIQNKDFKL